MLCWLRVRVVGVAAVLRPLLIEGYAHAVRILRALCWSERARECRSQESKSGALQ